MVIGVNVATAILLIIISFVTLGRQEAANHLLKNAQVQQQQADAAFKKLAVAYPLFATETPFVTKVADFEKMVKDKTAQVEELTHYTYRKPFSSYLYTLTQVTPQGLWLYNIHVNQDVHNVSLSGFTIDPVLVSKFVEIIQVSPPFTGDNFELMTVKKMPDGLNEFEVADEQLINPDLKHEEEHK